MFDASVIVDDSGSTESEAKGAARMAYDAMVLAAQGLLKMEDPDVKSDPAVVFPRFEAQFVETKLFFERFVGAQEWGYFQGAHQADGTARNRDEAHRRVEEANSSSRRPTLVTPGCFRLKPRPTAEPSRLPDERAADRRLLQGLCEVVRVGRSNRE